MCCIGALWMLGWVGHIYIIGMGGAYVTIRMGVAYPGIHVRVMKAQLRAPTAAPSCNASNTKLRHMQLDRNYS